MKEAIADVISGAVTYAVRDTKFDGNSVKKGDMIGLINNHLTVSGKTVAEATSELVRKMIAERGDEACTVTLYFGEAARRKTTRRRLRMRSRRVCGRGIHGARGRSAAVLLLYRGSVIQFTAKEQPISRRRNDVFRRRLFS
ncbi:MAG: hypothetical protein R2912_11735 [Eubacteriales bacterium]